MRLKLSGSLLAMSLLSASLTPAAHAADTLGLDFASGGSTFVASQFPGGSGGTLGWTFSVTSPITIDAVGIWDEGANGLGASKQVALWNNTNTTTPIFTATANATGTVVASADLAGDWVFTALASPVTLQTGNYTIGALYLGTDPDPYRFNTSAPIMAPGLTYGGGRYPTSGTQGQLLYPVGNGITGYFGANFEVQTTAAATPEPGTIAMFAGVSVSGLAFLRRKRTKR